MLPDITGKTAMLAKAGEPHPAADYVMEPKYDGHRIIAHVVDANEVHLYARSGVEKTHLMPNIARELRDTVPPGTIIDGEVVHWTDTGGDWSKVQEVLGSNDRAGVGLTFVMFDVLGVMHEDVRLHPQHVRRVFLEKIAESAEREHVRITEQYEWNPDHAQALMANGWEGAILKPANGVYKAGRHEGGWLKIKYMTTEDVVVIGATPGKGRFTGQIGALVFGQYVGGELVELGQCSGMTDTVRQEFTIMHESGTLAGTVIEVRHFGKHESGGWKSPQFKRVRTDKGAAECIAA